MFFCLRNSKRRENGTPESTKRRKKNAEKTTNNRKRTTRKQHQKRRNRRNTKQKRRNEAKKTPVKRQKTEFKLDTRKATDPPSSLIEASWGSNANGGGGKVGRERSLPPSPPLPLLEPWESCPAGILFFLLLFTGGTYRVWKATFYLPC